MALQEACGILGGYEPPEIARPIFSDGAERWNTDKQTARVERCATAVAGTDAGVCLEYVMTVDLIDPRVHTADQRDCPTTDSRKPENHDLFIEFKLLGSYGNTGPIDSATQLEDRQVWQCCITPRVQPATLERHHCRANPLGRLVLNPLAESDTQTRASPAGF